MAQTTQAESVEDLLLEADRLVADAASKGRSRNEKLISAREKVTALPAEQRKIDHADVIALKAEIEAAQLSLKSANDNLVSRGMVYTCIFLSMLLMFLVGSLSLVYNKGVALLSEVQTLAAQQPDRRFGQLERQLLVAQDDLFSPDQMQLASLPVELGGKPEDPKVPAKRPIDELARESSYLTLHELRDLNFKLKSLETRVGDFENLSASPFPGVLKLETFVGTAMASGRNFVGAFKTADVTTASPPSPEKPGGAGNAEAAKEPPAGNDTMNFFCRAQPAAKLENKDGKSVDGATTQAISQAELVTQASASQVLGMDMRKIVGQACKYSLNYVSMTVPSVDSWALRIKDAIDPYAVWILPCLYAALGSMIYYMRLILDTTQPNPPVYRIAHRMALAALAGMILAWFWGPTFGSNSEFKSVGFGLFTFAFVVGFSIDVFFALLDRLVFISTNAISKFGGN
ncbi:hypothetical protein RFN29_34565 [Mesorhizobium sp. VK22B]|uniref:Uncharacterized protein n=1 Tax=Mesorhizobium captivum TaxID=3072319 RepID=A0ABU4ZDJ6_9HYPH|nr:MULTISPECIES: hypothetical protein [unclassified Mesorhizobium]MDX8496628.1 hypothetical protein [Mesorhizobium sp. VK22B]MDX8510135.1 hypothetical protein [Mesorhizobium sp. VK22E]